MGQSDQIIIPWYKQRIKPEGRTALLGFTNEHMFSGDCYDKEKRNWEINSAWGLPVSYDTIVCLRTTYFSADPQDFIKRCHASLASGGRLYMDSGYGEHWRFPDFHIGWKYGDTHQYAYGEDNKLWSGLWDDSFMRNSQVQKFVDQIRQHGYSNLKEAIYKEVPKVLELSFVKRYFEVEWHALCTVKPHLQLYILLCGTKK